MKLTTLIVASVMATAASSDLMAQQTAREVLGPPAIVPLTQPQPPASLIVDPPLEEPLKEGHVFVQYRAINLHIVPVFGTKALEVTPRIGHIHVSVDGAPWHWADASGEPIVLVGFTPGHHSVLITLADANHKPLDSKTVLFDVPQPEGSGKK